MFLIHWCKEVICNLAVKNTSKEIKKEKVMLHRFHSNFACYEFHNYLLDTSN